MPESSEPQTESTPKSRLRVNSALRVLSVLNKLKATNAKSIAYRVVPPTFGITASTEVVEQGWAHIQASTMLIKMLDDFQLEVESSSMSEDERTYHLECRALVFSALAPVRLSQPWDQYKNAIPDTTITRVQSAEVALRRYVTEEMLAQADLKDLRDAIETALSTVKGSVLPLELKSLVAFHLLRVRAALDEYVYRGLAGLQEALAGYVGMLVTTREHIGKSTTKEQRAGLAQVLTTANALVTLAKGAAWVLPHLHAGFIVLAGLLASG